MPLFRGRRDDGGTKYRMREKMFAIGDDYWIENEEGERAFKVDGKALRIRDTLILEDGSGAELFTVQEKKLHIRDTMDIERGGNSVARVKKALITPLRERFSIEVEDGDDLEAKGNIVDHEYKIERGGDKVAEVSKRWFRVRDTYGIEIAPGPGRRIHPRRHRLHRPDDARLIRPPSGEARGRLKTPLCRRPPRHTRQDLRTTARDTCASFRGRRLVECPLNTGAEVAANVVVAAR